MKEYPLVSIITVNYENAALTVKLLESLQYCRYPNIEIWVVDNGSSDYEMEGAVHAFPNVNCIKSKTNLGFAGGNNLAIKKAKGDFIFLVNNDVEVTPDFLGPIVDLALSDDQIGVVSPKILFYNSQETIQYAGANAISPVLGRGSKIGDFEKDNGQYDEIRETDLGHGAAMLVPRKVVEEVGMLPEVYFLYYEEHDWVEAIKRSGYKVMYNGLSKVYHKESMSVGRVSPLKAYYMARNRVIYIRRNTASVLRVVSLSYFYLIALPKNLIQMLLKNRVKQALSYFKGALWNILNNKYQSINY